MSKLPSMVLITYLLALLACSVDEGPDPRTSLIIGGDGGDSFPVEEVSLYQALHGVHVGTVPAGTRATAEQLEDALKVYELHVEAGQSFAIVMRSASGDLDPYLLLQDAERRAVAEGRDQAALPFCAETDALVTYTATSAGVYYLFASSLDLRTGGLFDLDLIALDARPGADLSRTDETLLEGAHALRSFDDELLRFIEAGYVVEGAAGFLGLDMHALSDVEPSVRAEINYLVAAVNTHREHLFSSFAEADGRPAEAAVHVGQTCAQLWTALRE